MRPQKDSPLEALMALLDEHGLEYHAVHAKGSHCKVRVEVGGGRTVRLIAQFHRSSDIRAVRNSVAQARRVLRAEGVQI